VNKRDKDLLLLLSSKGYSSQRELADLLGCSLGAVNGGLKALLSEGYIDAEMRLSKKSEELLEASRPKRAVLLAAGFGIRLFSGKSEEPKALLTVHGETLIERMIEQLCEVGVYEIYVVVGFEKERFEYLIDKYGVTLIVNPEYAKKNNLHSLALAKDHLENAYIVPCDIRCKDNPFGNRELYSWYMVSDAKSNESTVRVNRKLELAAVQPYSDGNRMIGISYLLADDARIIREKLCLMDQSRRYEGSFWEETLYEGDKFLIGPKIVADSDVVEINTVEELWELDRPVGIPVSEIADVLGVAEDTVTDISVLKKGTTNHSYFFMCEGEKYILRVIGDETNKLIDRKNEAEVYRAISECGISEGIVYFNAATGLKISRPVTDGRFCDPSSPDDVSRCMKRLRDFHELKIKVGHAFDLFGEIEYFESLWGETPSVYRDYNETKANVFSLRPYIDSAEKDFCLTHIDPVPDNFLISADGIRLIDWEYAAMQDPHLDIAMFALYSLYDRAETDALIDAYFTEGCSDAVRLKIYCYMAVGGLLWSNWCEYRRKCGTEFGEYSIRQYRYAKEYFRIVVKELKEKGIDYACG